MEEPTSIVPASPAEIVSTIGRDAGGKFLPGNRITRRGAADKISRQMRYQGVEHLLARGCNPIVSACDFLMDKELPPRFRLDALRILVGVLWGDSHRVSLDLGDGEIIDEERITATKKMLAGLWLSEETKP